MSPARAANPAPRRALRKADDAGIHPATTRSVPLAPVAVSEADAPAPAEVEKQGPGRAPAEPTPEKSKKHKASDEQPTKLSGQGRSAGTQQAPGGATVSGPAVWDKRFHGNTADVLRARRTTHDLLLGAEGVLEVKVPKRLRKAARLEAETHGLTIDQVVTRLLADWLESR